MPRHLKVRHLQFVAASGPPVSFEFGPGLNIVTSQSANVANLIIEAADFVLGAARKPMLARFGFSKAVLGLEGSDGSLFTLERSNSGAAIKVYEGPPSQTIAADMTKSISPKHNPLAPDNISKLLLDKLGLGEALHWAEADETFKNLSFRSIAHYFVINEQDISKEGSLIETGQARTKDFELAVFNLLHGGHDPEADRASDTDATLQLLRLARLQTLEGIIEAAKRHQERSRSSARPVAAANAGRGHAGEAGPPAQGDQPFRAFIEELEDRMSALNWLTRRVEDSATPDAPIAESPETALCREISSLLQDWHMPNAGTVEFDIVARDFLLMASPRASLGKLGRGVVHAAFKIALLKLAMRKNFPHAGFVLAHAPFVEGRTRGGDEETTKALVQSRFYETLSAFEDGQLIIVQRGAVPEGLAVPVQQADFAEPRV